MPVNARPFGFVSPSLTREVNEDFRGGFEGCHRRKLLDNVHKANSLTLCEIAKFGSDLVQSLDREGTSHTLSCIDLLFLRKSSAGKNENPHREFPERGRSIPANRAPPVGDDVMTPTNMDADEM